MCEALATFCVLSSCNSGALARELRNYLGALPYLSLWAKFLRNFWSFGETTTAQ